jgi:hypothetical protein
MLIELLAVLFVLDELPPPCLCRVMMMIHAYRLPIMVDNKMKFIVFNLREDF